MMASRTPKAFLWKYWTLGIYALFSSLAFSGYALAFDADNIITPAFIRLSLASSIMGCLYFAFISRKGRTSRLSYGYARAELLGGFVAAATIFSSCFYLVLSMMQSFLGDDQVSQSSEKMIVTFWFLLCLFLGDALSLVVIHGGASVLSPEAGHAHVTPADEAARRVGGRRASFSAVAGRFLATSASEVMRAAAAVNPPGQLQLESPPSSPASFPLAGQATPPSAPPPAAFPRPFQERCPHMPHYPLAAILEKASFLASFVNLGLTLSLLVERGLRTFAPSRAMDQVLFWALPSWLILLSLIDLYFTARIGAASAMLLLMGTPQSLCVQHLERQIKELPEVIAIHEVHVWTLEHAWTVATFHVVIAADQSDAGRVFRNLIATLNPILHAHDIHEFSIQPEFVPKEARLIGEGVRSLSWHELTRRSSQPLCFLSCTADCLEYCCALPAPSPTPSIKDGTFLP
ncbi:Cation Diffusion Facilitator [Paratrimastix pyriformis]|uniref:Cation Diffusion Facilitator n=1 Tax=Paratrimastix pyriformis TaxID=342808 RepID=A0ABQ8UTK2_9EUKA|nr:Cation Diffusion Facilitator [Paratrimastix pyriformis]